MKVVFKDLKNGEIKLKPENLDDIWHLYNILEKGDLVRAITFRTAGNEGNDKIRSKKMEKKRMKLGIRVEEVGFHEFSDRLRIHGVIEEGPQDLGCYHTINIAVDDMKAFSIIKEKWRHHHLARIEDAVKASKQPLLTFVSMDEDSAVIAILRQSGAQHIATVESHRCGKMYESENTEKEYFGEIISILKTIKSSFSALVTVGPGFSKENFVKYGKSKEPSLFKNSVLFGAGSGGMNGVYEAIKAGVVNKITRENRVTYETGLVEQLFEEIAKENLASYGEKEVYNALETGAVEILLISDTMIRSKKGEKLLDLAKRNNSKFVIINTMHDAGKKLDGIGGIGAILRFKTNT